MSDQTVFFATNRNVRHETSTKGNLFFDEKQLGNKPRAHSKFNTESPSVFRVGDCSLTLADGASPFDDDAWSITKSRLYPDVSNPKETPPRYGSSLLFANLHDQLKASEDSATPKDVIIFIHGFQNTFQNSAIRAAQLQHTYGDAGRSAIVVFFSWPSDGMTIPLYSYLSDRRDARISGEAMSRAFARLIAFLRDLRDQDRSTIVSARRNGREVPPDALEQCNRKIHIIAHSMGNWALQNAIEAFTQEHGTHLPAFIENTFLMSPDVGDDVLENPASGIYQLMRMSQNMHIYHAHDDIALKISDWTKGNRNRLGSRGPIQSSAVPDNVQVIDCSSVSDTDDVIDARHQFYRKHPVVIEDVRASLAGRPFTGRAAREQLADPRRWRLKPSAASQN